MSLREFKAHIKAGQTRAERIEGQLRRTYQRLLTTAVEDAAKRFESQKYAKTHTITADADWQVPHPDELLTITTLYERLQAETDPIRRRLIETLIGATLKQFGIKFDVTNPLLEGVFSQLGSNIQSIAETTRVDIMTALQKAYDDGLSIKDAADAIRSVADISENRAALIARTEMNGASNGGSLAAARLTSAAPYKTWVTAHDDRVRDDHAEVDGVTIPIAEPFDVGGSQMMYPGDQMNGSPEELCNCRCTLVYEDSPGMALAAAAGTIEPVKAYSLPAGLPLESAPSTLGDVASGSEWEATLLIEGTPTDDGRMIMPGATTWRDLPLTLMAMVETQPGHDGAVVAGRIDEIMRRGNMVVGRGVFDSGEFGQEIARLVGDETLRGVSVDLAARDVRPTDRAGTEIPESELGLALDPQDVYTTVFEGVVLGATVCPMPAFADASITTITAGGEIKPALTAAAAGLVPLHPPAEWFEDPKLGVATPLTVTEDGRVYGHAALWASCHIGHPETCVNPPHSRTGYSYFHLGTVEAFGGDRVECGQITLGTSHAPITASQRRAAEHYDHTGSAVADIRCGEDGFGIWFAGALRPDTPASRVRQLSAAKLSGDWRDVNGNLELVGLLAVNVPGFPVPRVKARVAAIVNAENIVEEEHPVALVAAGLHYRDEYARHRTATMTALARGGARRLLDAIRA